MLTLYVRTAVRDDLDTLDRWREETAAWLARRHGSEQWSTPSRPTRRLAWMEQGATVMAQLEPDGDPVATCTLLPVGSARLWTPEELLVPARYLRRINVDRAYGGRGIGATLLAWARSRSARAGARVVRLNAWSSGLRLHAYYTDHGWRRLRTVPGLRSGALFEAAALARPDLPVHELGELSLPDQ